MIRRLTSLAAFAAVAVMLAPSAALAAGHGRIVDVSTVNGKLRLVFSATGLASGVGVNPASVKVTIDGAAVTSSAAPISATPTHLDRAAMLVIDTSGSMSGDGLNGAKAAADAFLTSVPADVRVGLVTFSDAPHVVVPPTTHRAAVASAISKLHAQGETALYDAVALALRNLGTSGLRNLLLLTDGADTRSHTKLDALLPAVQASKVTVDAVGFRTTDAQAAPLREIAANGGGEVVSASASAALAEAFHQAAQEISDQIIATVTVPQQFANGSHTIKLTTLAGSEQLTDSVFAPIGDVSSRARQPSSATYGPRSASVGKTLSRPVFYAGLIALFVAVVVLVAVALISINRQDRRSGVRRRLSIYTLTGRPVEESREESNAVLGDSAVARSAVELAGRVVARRDLEATLGQKLEAGGIPMRPAEWLILHVGIAVAAGILLLLVSNGGLLATFIGLGAGGLLPWLYLVIKESRRSSAFLERMPDTLQLMAGGLRAGYSLPQSIDAVVREGSEPIASEFNRALVETRLGVAIEDALEGVAARMRSVDFDWVVMAIRIQREVGGNLAEVLSTVSATLRERERLRRQVRVLSAEGRLSAWILGLLPGVFFMYLLLVRKAYIRTLWHDSIGVVMIIFLAIDLTVGIFWLRKVIRVEV